MRRNGPLTQNKEDFFGEERITFVGYERYRRRKVNLKSDSSLE